MVIVKIYGGMANQLFQYAAGYALAKHHATTLKLDIGYFSEKNKDTKRLFELDKFCIPYELATKEEISALFKFRKIDYAWNKILPISNKRFYGEKAPGFYPSFFDLPNNIYLRGYFQSEKYFIHYKQSILEQFSFRNQQFLHLSSLASSMSETPSVALHIRLGDYLNPNLSSIMAPFDIDYYQKAIDYIQQNVIHPRFYVFSDQINKAKDLLQIDADFVFIDHQITTNSDEDFYLMQLCQHQIIANSTFSWWAAYLNKNPHKIVIAPQKWYKPHFGDATNLFPKGWKVL